MFWNEPNISVMSTTKQTVFLVICSDYWRSQPFAAAVPRSRSVRPSSGGRFLTDKIFVLPQKRVFLLPPLSVSLMFLVEHSFVSDCPFSKLWALSTHFYNSTFSCRKHFKPVAVLFIWWGNFLVIEFGAKMKLFVYCSMSLVRGLTCKLFRCQ